MTSMQIATDAHVTLRYAVALAEDATPDLDTDGQTTAFILGRGQVLPGLEARLAGCADGERLDLVLTPGEAFGEHDPTLDLTVPWSDFPDGARTQLQPGVRFRGPHPADAEQVVGFTVREVRDDGVVASGNHPLAGRSLRVACEVLAVREATPEELAGGCGGGSCGTCGSAGACDSAASD